MPSGDDLTLKTLLVSVPLEGEWVQFDFEPPYVDVTLGERYAVVVRCDGIWAGAWGADDHDPYPGGLLCRSDDSGLGWYYYYQYDFFFRVYGQPTPCDLAITKTDSRDPVLAGNSLSYTLTVTNHGPSDASGVVVTDNLPSADISSISLGTPSKGSASESGGVVTWNVGNLANGSSATLTITVRVESSSTGKIINTATVSGAEADPITDNNTSVQETRVFSAATNVPGISLWGSAALAVLFSAMLIWLVRRRLILKGRTR
jgi:uncharacterized repeat protein (TIGR01451 family)